MSLTGPEPVVCDDLTVTSTAPPQSDLESPPVVQEQEQRHTSGRTLVLFGALLGVALMLVLPIRTWVGQRAELDTLRTEIDAARDRVAQLQSEQQQWQDPAYVEKQARLRLNMVAPGEAGLILLDPQDRIGDEVAEAPPTTWYEKVWRSTDTAAGRRPAPPAEE